MRILLAAKHAPLGRRQIGGVQSWCTTVAALLGRLGHSVAMWGPELPVPRDRFDLGIMANLGDTAPAAGLCDRVLNVCHGIIPAEAPVGDRVVFTSEGIRDHWNGSGPVIRQPINLDFWSPAVVVRENLTRFSYRGGLGFLPAVAADLSLQFRHVRDLGGVELRHMLRRSVCVLATGRAALEAMACGVPVVICDHRSAYQGPLLDPDTLGSMARNYSGRGGVEPTPEIVAEAVQAAVGRGSLRDHVAQHHDAGTVTKQILEAAGC
ncbi:glycosyltransferase [Marilutibacter spongiae]|uniref:Glycosyltransferase family 4 protein n=1 Tax=Marilutibacter spongiae TaxID=2025720 RepID=A0A7W3TLX5_9GAMM|nr:hypothetical protein [Lysobacter spongiae]MBB1060424.1 hypothetical protein [Lysobacter spongiae]